MEDKKIYHLVKAVSLLPEEGSLRKPVPPPHRNFDHYERQHFFLHNEKEQIFNTIIEAILVIKKVCWKKRYSQNKCFLSIMNLCVVKLFKIC